MIDIWHLCEGDKQIQPLQCIVWRIVENQYQTSTRKLVDSREEQEILEEEIESQKPTLPNTCEKYHYLLSTPFRYPPLKNGSRFGTRYERSLWYGSINLETALAEKAYHRLRLLTESEAKFDELPISYCAFQTEIETKNGINLTEPPFSSFRDKISNKDSYDFSQSLGKKMRESNIVAFFFTSARCSKNGRNVGLFLLEGFKTKAPSEPFQTWQGTVTSSKSRIEFVRTNGIFTETHTFSKE